MAKKAYLNYAKKQTGKFRRQFVQGKNVSKTNRQVYKQKRPRN